MGKNKIGGNGEYEVEVNEYKYGMMKKKLRCKMVVMDGLG